jgi:hypothetical protein
MLISNIHILEDGLDSLEQENHQRKLGQLGWEVNYWLIKILFFPPMKFFLFVVLLFFQSSTCFSLDEPRKCSSTQYITLGGKCNGNTTKCKSYMNCKENKCVYSYLNCEKDSDCYLYDRFGVQCIQNNCQKPQYAGLPCLDNQQCYSGKCDGTKCTGLKLNEECDPIKTQV